MKLNELKPCCKCGCEAELISSQTFAWCNVYWYIRCTNEDCEEETMLKYDTKRDAINAWNRRAKMENLNAENIINEIQSLIKALKDCGGWVERGNGEGWFNHEILADALALITSQEQRIKELTRENKA